MHKRKKEAVYNNTSELYNKYLEIYFNQYDALSDAKKRNLVYKYDRFLLMDKIMITSLKMKNQLNDKKNEESDMPPLKGDDEEIKEEK